MCAWLHAAILSGAPLLGTSHTQSSHNTPTGPLPCLLSPRKTEVKFACQGLLLWQLSSKFTLGLLGRRSQQVTLYCSDTAWSLGPRRCESCGLTMGQVIRLLRPSTCGATVGANSNRNVKDGSPNDDVLRTGYEHVLRRVMFSTRGATANHWMQGSAVYGRWIEPNVNFHVTAQHKVAHHRRVSS